MPLGRGRVVGGLRLAAAPSLLGVVGGLLRLVGRAGGLGLGAGIGLQAVAGGIKLGFQGFAPGQFCGQPLWVLAFGVGGLGLCGQLCDVGGELGPQFAGAIVAHRAYLRGVGVDLGAVDRHRAEPQQAGFARQQQNLHEGRLERSFVGAAEDGDRIVIGVQVGGDEPHRDVAVGRPLDPAGRKDAVGVAVNQQRQHQPGMILRLAARLRPGPERTDRHTLDRGDDEMRQVIIGNPGLQVGR